MCYERHTESMRTVPWLRPAVRDPVSGDTAEHWRAPAARPQIDSLMMAMTSKALTPIFHKPQYYHHKIEVDAPELKPYAHFFSGLLLFTSLSNGRFVKMKRVLHFGASNVPKCSTVVKSKTGLLLFTTL